MQKLRCCLRDLQQLRELTKKIFLHRANNKLQGEGKYKVYNLNFSVCLSMVSGCTERQILASIEDSIIASCI